MNLFNFNRYFFFSLPLFERHTRYFLYYRRILYYTWETVEPRMRRTYAARLARRNLRRVAEQVVEKLNSPPLHGFDALFSRRRPRCVSAASLSFRETWLGRLIKRRINEMHVEFFFFYNSCFHNK